MTITIDEAITALSEIITHYPALNKKVVLSIDLAIMALQTIDDGNYILTPPSDNPPIDLKTLYEQTTLFCTKICTITDHLTHQLIEVYHQPETPLYILFYWNKDKGILEKATYTTNKAEWLQITTPEKENKPQ